MKVRIEFVPHKTSEIDFAKQVKNIAKELMETCARCGVSNLIYTHDYFSIKIEQQVTTQSNIVELDNLLVEGETDGSEN